MITHDRLDEATKHARLLHVALSIAHEWARHGVPVPLGLECVNNAVAACPHEVGLTHVLHDALTYRKGSPALYPEWQAVSVRPITLTTLALGVWRTKGWRR